MSCTVVAKVTLQCAPKSYLHRSTYGHAWCADMRLQYYEYSFVVFLSAKLPLLFPITFCGDVVIVGSRLHHCIAQTTAVAMSGTRFTFSSVGRFDKPKITRPSLFRMADGTYVRDVPPTYLQTLSAVRSETLACCCVIVACCGINCLCALVCYSRLRVSLLVHPRGASFLVPHSRSIRFGSIDRYRCFCGCPCTYTPGPRWRG